jgi:O-antigen ligase
LGAFVGAIYLIFLSAKKYWILKERESLFFGFGFFSLLLTILSKYKSDSTKGRLHIYHLSIKLLRENWLHGIGFQKFRVEFNEQQAAYFSNRSLDNNISLLADNTFYAFNDTLQWIIETGIVGFLILVLFFAFLIRRVILLKKRHKQIASYNLPLVH